MAFLIDWGLCSWFISSNLHSLLTVHCRFLMWNQCSYLNSPLTEIIFSHVQLISSIYIYIYLHLSHYSAGDDREQAVSMIANIAQVWFGHVMLHASLMQTPWVSVVLQWIQSLKCTAESGMCNSVDNSHLLEKCWTGHIYQQHERKDDDINVDWDVLCTVCLPQFLLICQLSLLASFEWFSIRIRCVIHGHFRIQHSVNKAVNVVTGTFVAHFHRWNKRIVNFLDVLLSQQQLYFVQV